MQSLTGRFFPSVVLLSPGSSGCGHAPGQRGGREGGREHGREEEVSGSRCHATDWEEHRSERERVNSEPVVRGLAFGSYFNSTPSVCNLNLRIVQRVLAADRSLAWGESLSKGLLQTSVHVSVYPQQQVRER